MSDKKYSKPFGIAQFGESEEESNQGTVKFELDLEGNPIRLGDGSFGVVWRGLADGPCAIKLLYDNSTLNPRPLSNLTPDDLKHIAASVAAEFHFDEKIATELANAIELKKDNLDELAIAIARLLPDNTVLDGRAPDGQKYIQASDVWKSIRRQTSSDAADRFRAERDAFLNLIFSTNKLVITGLIKIKGGTEAFLSSFLHQGDNKPIKEYFDGKGYSLSEYALVMDLYEYSLKDLLEKDSGSLKLARQDGMRGYDRLRSMTLEQRVREALLFLKPIIAGLVVLHSAKSEDGRPFFHLDIKPANILIRPVDDPTGYAAVLADLGNLPPKPDPAQSVRTLTGPPPMAPGSPNYRSPEQKYYMDIAYAKVTHESISKTVRLEINDPKFKSNMFEQGDYVIFSKDKDRKEKFLVSSPREDGNGIVTVELTADASVEDEPRIQVEFHKQQLVRTDMFGIGAIAYDIITCGESPERFYERIRGFDSDSYPVDLIIARYKNLSVGQADVDDPDLLQIFKPFRDHSEFADVDIVEFILKCMLYRSPGTFYSNRKQNAAAAERDSSTSAQSTGQPAEMTGTDVSSIEQIGSSTNDLPQSQEPQQWSVLGVSAALANNSPLWQRYIFSGDLRPGLMYETNDGGRAQTADFREEIDRLQGLNTESENPAKAAENVSITPADTTGSTSEDSELLREANRLVLGAFYFLQLVKFVKAHVLTSTVEEKSTAVQGATDDKKSKVIPGFLYQMLPEYIILNQQGQNVVLKFDSPIPTYGRIDDYLIDLKNNLLGRMVRQGSNPFVPAWVSAMRREMRLRPLQQSHQEIDPPDTNVASYQYRLKDHAWYRAMIRPEDRVVYKQQQVGRILPRQDETSDDLLTIQWDVLPEPEKADDVLDVAYFAHLDPSKYYLDMLGIYLQHLIFAHSALTTTTRDKLDPRSIVRLLDVTEDIFLVAPANAGTMFDAESANGRVYPDVTVADLGYIYKAYVHLFLGLTLHESHDSYSAEKKRRDEKEPSAEGRHMGEILDEILIFARNQYDRVHELVFGRKARPEASELPDTVTELTRQLRLVLNSFAHDPAYRFDMERAIKQADILWVQ